MKRLLQLSVLFTSVVFTSCGGWSEDEQHEFIENCENKKFARGYCECVLEKSMNAYSNFGDFKNDQGAWAEILSSPECLEKDVE